MQVNRPKEYRPELADASRPRSKEEQMRQSLGLGPDEGSPGDEEDEAPPPPPVRKGAGAAPKAGGSDKRVAELEAKNAELEKRLASEASRRDEQVETIKKLANSRMANITKSFEEKLAAKEREMEDLSFTSAGVAEQLAQVVAHGNMLEQQLKGAGLQPASASAGSGSEDKLLGEIERLRKENAALRSKPASTNGDVGTSSDAEKRELKKTIDNLMEANSRLVSNTKSKIAMLESELERYKSGGGGGNNGSSASVDSGAASAQIAKMQKILEDESNERKKAVEEVARLRREMEEKGASAERQSGDAAAQVKDLQKQNNELSKQLGHKDAQLKAQIDDFSLKEKDLKRQITGLEEEKSALVKAGTAELQATRSKMRKCGRRIVQDVANLKAASQAAREACMDLNKDMMPAMKSFYQPLKKALKHLEAYHSGWKDKYEAAEKERKKLHNLVLELKGNIRVFCRVRPQLKHEAGTGCEKAIFFKDDERPELEEKQQISVLDDAKGSEKMFEFDHCFGPSSTQEQVFAEVEALVTSVLDGYNVCIFAYGQTGSGKTFSMEGSVDQPGINPRTLSRVFEQIQERSAGYAYNVEFSTLEIYNEEIRDLLEPGKDKKLDIRQGPDGFYVQDLCRESVATYDEVRGSEDLNPKS
jgi:kinesin family protein C2/C3